MSKYDKVSCQAQQHSHGKQRLKRCVLRRLRKTGSDWADVTCCGRLPLLYHDCNKEVFMELVQTDPDVSVTY